MYDEGYYLEYIHPIQPEVHPSILKYIFLQPIYLSICLSIPSMASIYRMIMLI